MAFTIHNRRVMIRKGTKTQTIKICTVENLRARYDYIVRIRPPFVSEDTLKSQCFDSIEELVRFSEVQHGGIVEASPKKEGSKQSVINMGYLIHLLRAEKVNEFEPTEDILLDLERNCSNIKPAYAGVTSTRVAFKLIGDIAITRYEVKNQAKM